MTAYDAKTCRLLFSARFAAIAAFVLAIAVASCLRRAGGRRAPAASSEQVCARRS